MDSEKNQGPKGNEMAEHQVVFQLDKQAVVLSAGIMSTLAVMTQRRHCSCDNCMEAGVNMVILGLIARGLPERVGLEKMFVGTGSIRASMDVLRAGGFVMQKTAKSKKDGHSYNYYGFSKAGYAEMMRLDRVLGGLIN